MSAGLFRIRVGGGGATDAAAAGLPLARRADPHFAQATGRGLRRYCSGCSRETEHVLCLGGDGASIPAIRWPAARPANGTTICVDCGQWRTAAPRPSGPVWSSWPRVSAERPETARLFDDPPLEAAAESEGMLPRRGPARPRRRQPARTMKKAIATY